MAQDQLRVLHVFHLEGRPEGDLPEPGDEAVLGARKG